jgi:hypothetical protein
MTHHEHDHDPLESPARAHEDSDVRAAPVAIFLVSLAFLVLGSFLVVAWLFSFFESQEQRRYQPMLGLEIEPELPPEPRLQPSPTRDLREMREIEEQMLNNYGWVNKQGGLVRIPIDRAMELVLERGLPDVPAQQPISPGQAGTRQDSPAPQQAVPGAGTEPAPEETQPARPDGEINGTQSSPQVQDPDGAPGPPEGQNE